VGDAMEEGSLALQFLRQQASDLGMGNHLQSTRSNLAPVSNAHYDMTKRVALNSAHA
jgi:hypothetical protein